MKQSLSLTIFFFVVLHSLAQQSKVTADTFFFSQKFSHKTIIIRSDSTYCLRETGCTSSFLSMGFWTKESNIFLLSGLYDSNITASTEFLADENLTDSLITFQVRDCYGNPIPKYYIDFYTKDLIFDTSYLIDSRTDDKGILKLRRSSVPFYITETDQNNQEDFKGNYSDIVYRRISQSAKTITIILSFPKKIVQDYFDNNFYKYKARKFQVKDKVLLDIETGNKYLMK